MTMNLSNLPTCKLGKVVIACPDITGLAATLKNHKESRRIIVCNSKDLIGIDKLLINDPIYKVIVLNNEEDNDIREWYDGLLFDRIIEVNNTKQLLRHLSTEAMLSYFNQGLEHKKKGNYGLANLCFSDSINALNCSAEFI
ncbi:unnamed protein product [Rotaria sp. Silwood2]|nr:unnamed protein product [Rotaria sp. Silwood2]CAF2863014.1 unnamed protein product [Rotaria sp. Silwood2]CAF3365003.1 unnamed protein product [Rotaria sp. Silwood2]CAF4056700.1 unnamed protein product [Rotaria sp. Silwood2]CAF4103583.1 unnamed protein product [Rotaria sp. Silwood2]